MEAQKENFISKIKQNFNSLPPDKKKKVVIFLVALGVIFISMVGYFWSRTGETPQKKEATKYEDIKLDPGVLEKTQFAESQKKLKELEEQLELMKQEKQKEEEERKRKEEEEARKKAEKQAAEALPPVVPPPIQGGANQGQLPPPTPPQPEILGGIGMVSQQTQTQEQKETVQETKKKYYLPTSFMEATLLSGLDAPAISKAEGNPMPALFRIKAPAVLPNKVKANLKGCFVIAEGLGSLADERAHLRLVSLSCIDRKGNAVIDQKVKGFVVDNDGKIGLRGRVVSKMGAHLARSLIAGFFGGIGNVSGQFGYNYSVTGAGVVSTPETSRITQAAVGSGISQAAQNLQKFYLDLAQQTIPVIEIQATRNVTIVISEGVELAVKEYDQF